MIIDDFEVLEVLESFTNLSVEPFSFDSAKEELWTISVWPSICHWENSWSSVLQLKVFIFELVSIDGFTTGTIVICEITALNLSWNYVWSRKRMDRWKLPSLISEWSDLIRQGLDTRFYDLLWITWHINCVMTLWKDEPLYPKPFSPVQSARKFSAVFGTTSERSSMTIRPASWPPMEISKKQRGRAIFISEMWFWKSATTTWSCIKKAPTRDDSSSVIY